MSALLCYQSKNRLVMVSDGRAHGRDAETFPKFQCLTTRLGVCFLGGVGNRGVIARLFYPMQRVCEEQGFTFRDLEKFVPGAIDFILKKREPSEINPDRDTEFPPAQVFLAGYDDKAQRMRTLLILKNAVGTGVTHEFAETDFAAVGFFQPEDISGLSDFTKKLRQTGEALSAAQVARLLANKIDATATKYPEHVGPAEFFAAINEIGLVNLPPDMPLPFSIAELVTQ